MTATAVNLDEVNVRSEEECPIVNGRYLIVPEGDKKPVSHQRVTNLVRLLDDTYRLQLWDKRQVALGLVARPDLLARIAATRPDDRDALDKLCADAKEAAKASAKANLGTALHAFAERVDLGELGVEDIPDPWRADIVAYRAALDEAGIEILEVERYVVHPAPRLVAGRLDRIVSFGTTPKILDLKTGALDWSAGAIAAQLAAYASASTLYDPKTQRHAPLPELDQDVAVVAHVPAGEGRATLHWVDIARGRRGLALALELRDWRYRQRELMEAWQPAATPDATNERRAGFRARIQALAFHPGALDQLVRLWPAGIPTLRQSDDHSPAQLDAIDDVLSRVEADHRAPFGPVDVHHNASLQPRSQPS